MKYLSDPNKTFTRIIPREEEWLEFIERYETKATSRSELIKQEEEFLSSFLSSGVTFIEVSMKELRAYEKAYRKECEALIAEKYSDTDWAWERTYDGVAYITEEAQKFLAFKIEQDLYCQLNAEEGKSHE